MDWLKGMGAYRRNVAVKKAIPLKACPWCNKTASVKIDISNYCKWHWLVRVYCPHNCPMNLKTREISIRKSQRGKADWIEKKVRMAVDIWNSGNLPYLHEGFEMDFEQIAEDFKAGKLETYEQVSKYFAE